MRRLTSEDYEALAEQIVYDLEQEDDNTFKGTFDHKDIRLDVDFMVYRAIESRYDMSVSVIYKIVPIWTECRTFTPDDTLVENDYAWYKLERALKLKIASLV